MTLLIPWYDFLCFIIVVGSIFAAIWMLLHKENDGTRKCTTKYESLLVSQPDQDNAIISAKWTQPNHLGSHQLWTSCWRNLNPVWLLLTRFLSFVIMVRVLAWDIQVHGKIMFLYYTEWTFTLVIIYFALGTITSAQECWENSKKPDNENNERNSSAETNMAESSESKTTISFWANKVRATVRVQSYREHDDTIAGYWGYLMQTVYQTCAGAVILTDIVFWFLIVPFLSVERVQLNLLMGCMHSLNVVFLLIDTALNRLPFPWFRLAYFVLFSCTYIILQWVLHACGVSWWPYPFIDLSTPWAPLWYLCMALIHIPCYGLYALIVKLKNGVFPKWFPRAFVRVQ